MLIFLYLTYSSTTNSDKDASGKKSLPKITKRMLNPEFITPTTRSSPIDRDPFEVSWASYINGTGVYGATTKPGKVTTAPTTKPTKTVCSTQPRVLEPPPLPRPPAAIFIGENYSMAVIGDEICKEGSLIGGKDARQCWLLEKIQKDQVTIRFGKIRRILKMSSSKKEQGQQKLTSKTIASSSESSKRPVAKEARR